MENCYDLQYLDDPQILYLKGKERYRNNQLDQAIEYLNRSIELSNSFAPAHFWLGKVYIQTGYLNKAKRCFDQALRINPLYAKAKSASGDCARFLCGFQSARDLYLKALEIDPEDAEIHCHLGIVYWDLHQDQRALDALTMAVMLDPDNEEAGWYLKLCLDGLKDNN